MFATIHCRIPAPSDAASAPLVTIAAEAPIHTIMGTPKRAAIAAAVTCPTSPHSEKKIAAKEKMAAFEAAVSRFFSDVSTGLNHKAIAIAMKLALERAATKRGGNSTELGKHHRV